MLNSLVRRSNAIAIAVDSFSYYLGIVANAHAVLAKVLDAEVGEALGAEFAHPLLRRPYHCRKGPSHMSQVP